MSKRRSSNRRSSRSSRYTGSAILDPDTDVVDNAHPYWWKNLENNTMGRASTDFNMLNETSRQLDSNSQIMMKEAQDGWWNVLDTPNSLTVAKQNTKQDGAKIPLSTPESEEEPRIVRRKLPLRSRIKTHQDNAFFNALNESKDTSASGETQKAGKRSSLNNKTVTNKEQVSEASDNSLNQSLNSNNVLKSKPKIFKKNYKDRDKNVFVDVLQKDESKVPFRKRSSVVKSPKIMEQKDSSRLEAPLNNQSGSMECTLTFEGSHELSHLPAPKAQSTTLEDSTMRNSSKNDSINDTEHKIVKPKPKLLQRRSRGGKKNVFQDIFENETTDEEIETTKSTNKNVAEKTEIPARSTRSLSKKLSQISQELPKDIVNEGNDETVGNETPRTRTKRKSAIIATKNIRRSNEHDSVGNDTVEDIPMQPDISTTLKIENEKMVTNVQNKTSNSSKRKSTRERSALSQNLVGDKNDERTLSIDDGNVNQLPASVPADSTKVKVSNKLQQRSADNISSSLNRKEPRSTENRSKISTGASNLASSVNKIMDMNSSTSNVDDENEMEIEDEVLFDPNYAETTNKLQHSEKKQKSVSERSATNVSSSFDQKERKNTGSRVSSKIGNLALSVKESTQTNARVSNVGDKAVTDKEDKLLNDTDNEEMLNKSQQRVSQRRSATNISSSSERKVRRNTKNRSRVSTRASNLASSINKIMDMNSSTSDVGNENEMEIEDEVLRDPDNRETSKQLQYPDKKRKSISERRSAANVSSSFNKTEGRNTENLRRISARDSNLVLSVKEVIRLNSKVVIVDNMGINRTDNDVSTDLNNEDIPNAHKEQQNVSHRRSVITNSFRSNGTGRGNAEDRSRISSRGSNLVLSAQEITQPNIRVSNVGDKGVRETEDEVSTDFNVKEVPNAQYADKEQKNISQMSTVHNSSDSDGEESRASYSAPWLNRIVGKDSSVSSFVGKFFVGMEDEVSSDSDNAVKQPSMFERRSVARSSNFDNKEATDTDKSGRLSAARSLRSSGKGIKQMNRNTLDVADKDIQETEEEILNAETPKKSQQPGRNTNVFEKMFAANIPSPLSGKKSVGGRSSSLLLHRSSNILPPFIDSSTIQGISKSKLQTTIRNFFSATRSPKVPRKQLFASMQNGEKIKEELEMMKKEEMDRMNAVAKKQTELLSTVGKKMNGRKQVSKVTRNKTAPPRQVHKAYLVNGQVYKVPRLPRPKTWVTDRLYKYLWKCMEPKYKLETRVVSEKFVRQLSEVTSSIAKQKSYNNYRKELYALMKEMARLGIIRTRNDFYNFCHDFLPYELRVKMVPMLLPGNKRNIPYDPSKLHEPLFDESR